MTESVSDTPLSRVLLIIAAIMFIIWGTRQAQPVLVSLLLALFLAVLATPPVLWLQRKRVPTLLAVSLVILAMVLILLAIGAVVGASIGSFYEALPHYQARFQEQATAFKAFLVHRGIASPGKVFLKYVDPNAVMNLTADLLMKMGAAFSNIILILLTTTFILLEASSFPVKLRAILGDPNQAFPRFTAFVNNMKRYMVIKTLMSLATGLLVGIWLTILQVDFPVLWGFLAFLLNYVPSIGSTIAGIPAVILAFIQLGLGKAILAAAGYMVINLVVDYGIEKRLMGRRLGLSTLVVFF
jgi:predicted PurR-regulated permease PerM